MGRQTNFYMYGNDQIRFFDFVQQDPDVVFIPTYSKTKKFKPLTDLTNPGYIYFWNKRFSPPFIVTRIDTAHYAVNETFSEIIDFSPSNIDENGDVTVGRIHAQMTYWMRTPPHNLMQKSPDFIKWYDSLARWLQKNSKPHPSGYYRLFPGAAEYQANRGKTKGRRIT